MKQARKFIGYCPQFDALSDLLTVKDHFYLYASIKGIPKDR
jgi:ATP-binding cassette, subfamily A (ABC1), member 3